VILDDVANGDGTNTQVETQPALRSAVPGQSRHAAVDEDVPDALDVVGEAPAEPEAAPDVVATPERTGRLHRAGRAIMSRTIRWLRHPMARLVLPALLVVTTLVLAGLGGGYLVPGLKSGSAAQPAPSDNASAGPTGDPTDEPSAGTAAPEPPGTTASPGLPAGTAGRPADALTAWATPIASKLGIPVVAMKAYGYAELVVTSAQPACHLHWTTLAGIGKVESNHGQAHATLSANGMVRPPIIGPALDGTNGRIQMVDTDRGLLDNDTTWDHAVGPMQFIPLTWRTWGTDADNDNLADPNNINDATLSAARYLCADNRDLARPDGWWAAVLSYNALRSYAQDVFDAANDYGIRSRG
jgi:hypothetical protein